MPTASTGFRPEPTCGRLARGKCFLRPAPLGWEGASGPGLRLGAPPTGRSSRKQPEQIEIVSSREVDACLRRWLNARPSLDRGASRSLPARFLAGASWQRTNRVLVLEAPFPGLWRPLAPVRPLKGL